MEKCARCSRSEEEVRLFDGIYVNAMVRVCERCALLNGITLIKRPSTDQLKDSEKPYGVKTRLIRMNHLEQETRKEKSIFDEVKKLEEAPELEQPEDLVFKLVDNFKWVLQTERRRKGYTVKQLAEAIKESESAILLLEKGIVPSKSIDLIRTLEQFLKIKLIRRDLIEQIEEKKKEEEKKRVFLESKKPLIPSAKEIILETNETPKLETPKIPFTGSMSLDRKEAQDFKLRDLQRLNDKIDNDFDYDKKSSQDIGQEQVENIGKEDTEKIKRTIYKDSYKSKSSVPTIYDLMKRKEERDKSMVGKDIEVIDDKQKTDKIG